MVPPFYWKSYLPENRGVPYHMDIPGVTGSPARDKIPPRG
jgi:hypothetical protein